MKNSTIPNFSLEVRESPGKGRGVFCRESIPAGAEILLISGPEVNAAEREALGDMYLQVTATRFLGLSGAVDDYLNHSCEPNCGLREAGETLALFALAEIPSGAELTFDYSTSTDEGQGWAMPCCCGAPSCRGSARDWRTLSPELQAKYRALGAVPGFVDA